MQDRIESSIECPLNMQQGFMYLLVRAREAHNTDITQSQGNRNMLITITEEMAET